MTDTQAITLGGLRFRGWTASKDNLARQMIGEGATRAEVAEALGVRPVTIRDRYIFPVRSHMPPDRPAPSPGGWPSEPLTVTELSIFKVFLRAMPNWVTVQDIAREAYGFQEGTWPDRRHLSDMVRAHITNIRRKGANIAAYRGLGYSVAVSGPAPAWWPIDAERPPLVVPEALRALVGELAVEFYDGDEAKALRNVLTHGVVRVRRKMSVVRGS
ncbi:MAG: hypothetical protein ACKVT1_02465 [Dehalococcoidia bacterium]